MYSSSNPLICEEDAYPTPEVNILSPLIKRKEDLMFVPNFNRFNLSNVHCWVQQQNYPHHVSPSNAENTFIDFHDSLKNVIVLIISWKRVWQGKYPYWFSKQLIGWVKRKEMLRSRLKRTLSLCEMSETLTNSKKYVANAKSCQGNVI